MKTEIEWPELRGALLRRLDRTWFLGAIIAAGIVVASYLFTRQIEYLTFGIFVAVLYALGWIVARIRFIKNSASAEQFNIWSNEEMQRNLARTRAVGLINGPILIAVGILGLLTIAISHISVSLQLIAWTGGALLCVLVGVYLLVSSRSFKRE